MARRRGKRENSRASSTAYARQAAARPTLDASKLHKRPSKPLWLVVATCLTLLAVLWRHARKGAWGPGAWAPSGAAGKKIVILAGGRSGSSFLQSMFDSDKENVLSWVRVLLAKFLHLLSYIYSNPSCSACFHFDFLIVLVFRRSLAVPSTTQFEMEMATGITAVTSST